MLNTKELLNKFANKLEELEPTNIDIHNESKHSLFIEVCEIIDNVNGFLDYNRLYEWSADTIDDLFSNAEKMEIIRMTHFGKINWNDEFFKVNAYGNFETSPIKDYHQVYDWGEIAYQIDRLSEKGDLADIYPDLPYPVSKICDWYCEEKYGS